MPKAQEAQNKMPKLRDVLSFIEKAIKIAGIFIGLLIQLGMMLAIPIGLLYLLIKPIFGSNPSGEYISMALSTGQFLLVLGGIFGVVYIVASLASRFQIVASALTVMAGLLVAILVAGALVQCASGDHHECRESRYVTC